MSIALHIDQGGGANFEGYHLRNVGSLHVGGSALAAATLQVTGTMTVSGAVTLTGLTGFPAGIALAATQRIYLDGVAGTGDTYIYEQSANVVHHVAGGTLSFFVDANGAGVTATRFLYLDGGGDTYFTEAAANQVQLVAGGTITLNIDSANARSFIDGSFALSTLNRLYFDASGGGFGGDTYIYESAANVLNVVAGGVDLLHVTSGGISIPAAKQLWLDNGGDTYLIESVANQLDLVTGSVTSLSLTTIGAAVGGHLSVTATGRIHLDGSIATGDTYIHEVSANLIQIVSAGTPTLGIAAGSVGLPATGRLYLDGVSVGGDTYIEENSANAIYLVAGGVMGLFVGAGGSGVNPTVPFYLDGGGDTYIYESSANVISFFTGGSEKVSIGTLVAITGALTVSTTLGVTGLAGFTAGIAVASGQRIYLDGVAGTGDTYIVESAANTVRFVAGGVNIWEFAAVGIFLGTGMYTPAGTATVPSLRIPHGVAPTLPTNGDMWTTTAGLFIQINGVTKTVTLT